MDVVHFRHWSSFAVISKNPNTRPGPWSDRPAKNTLPISDANGWNLCRSASSVQSEGKPETNARRRVGCDSGWFRGAGVVVVGAGSLIIEKWSKSGRKNVTEVLLIRYQGAGSIWSPFFFSYENVIRKWCSWVMDSSRTAETVRTFEIIRRKYTNNIVT